MLCMHRPGWRRGNRQAAAWWCYRVYGACHKRSTRTGGKGALAVEFSCLGPPAAARGEPGIKPQPHPAACCATAAAAAGTGRAKKSGAGGKYTWGAQMYTDGEESAATDPNDPNYDSGGCEGLHLRLVGGWWECASGGFAGECGANWPTSAAFTRSLCSGCSLSQQFQLAMHLLSLRPLLGGCRAGPALLLGAQTPFGCLLLRCCCRRRQQPGGVLP